jgi:hypothetical protein
VLVQMMRLGLVDFDVSTPPCTRTVGERPLGAPMARLQAERGGTMLTHLRHDQMTVPPAHLQVLRLLDGTRTAAEIIAQTPSGQGILTDLANNAFLVAPL